MNLFRKIEIIKIRRKKEKQLQGLHHLIGQGDQFVLQKIKNSKIDNSASSINKYPISQKSGRTPSFWGINANLLTSFL